MILLPIVRVLENQIQAPSRTFRHRFKDFQGPCLFPRTFQALKIWKNYSRTFKDLQEPCKLHLTTYTQLPRLAFCNNKTCDRHKQSRERLPAPDRRHPRASCSLCEYGEFPVFRWHREYQCQLPCQIGLVTNRHAANPAHCDSDKFTTTKKILYAQNSNFTTLLSHLTQICQHSCQSGRTQFGECGFCFGGVVTWNCPSDHLHNANGTDLSKPPQNRTIS